MRLVREGHDAIVHGRRLDDAAFDKAAEIDNVVGSAPPA
jgi:hypothetical protein